MVLSAYVPFFGMRALLLGENGARLTATEMIRMNIYIYIQKGVYV